MYWVAGTSLSDSDSVSDESAGYKRQLIINARQDDSGRRTAPQAVGVEALHVPLVGVEALRVEPVDVEALRVHPVGVEALRVPPVGVEPLRVQPVLPSVLRPVELVSLPLLRCLSRFVHPQTRQFGVLLSVLALAYYYNKIVLY